ncbi:MAG: thiol-disulfide isomerase/thioredoxin [Akkermansiaceae bacterium]|jgi:thiol-disulfide isomerase/thioredoxin
MQAPDESTLNTAIKNGRKAGLPEQMILEARFIYLINQNDTAALAALAPKLAAQLPKYSPDDTMIFGVKEDFESIIHYTKALAALQKNDTALFKKHITEAYWLSPSHGAQFAPHINEVRLKEAMAKVTLDLDRSYENQKKGNVKTSLKEIAADSPAFLIHFWSPWVQPSIQAMPEFAEVAKTLTENKIPVTSFLLAGTAESRKDATDFLTADRDQTPGHWLIDTVKSSLASTLRVATFPTVVLVKNDGTILFNGDPADLALWQKLASINSAIKPPTINPVLSAGGPEEDTEASPATQDTNQ